MIESSREPVHLCFLRSGQSQNIRRWDTRQFYPHLEQGMAGAVSAFFLNLRDSRSNGWLRSILLRMIQDRRAHRPMPTVTIGAELLDPVNSETSKMTSRPSDIIRV